MTVLDMTIRKALASEAERLADIGYLAWERDLRPFLPGELQNRQAERRRLQLAVHDLLDRTIVAERDGIPIGWCARARGRAYIPYLFVAPLSQNQGIGTLLLKRMESVLELEGCECVQLDTLSDNVRAVSFYQHQGYQILALKREGPPGRDPQTSVRLEKRLSPYRGPLETGEED
jgi:ribosomal-protein-alanine N-acetyltransferase